MRFARAWTWRIVNAGMLECVSRKSRSDLLERVRGCAPEPAARRHRAARKAFADDLKAQQGGASKTAKSRRKPPRPGVNASVEERLKHALVKGIDAFVEPRHRGVRGRNIARAARDHRRTIDGRHARGRRSVRRRQDVPAAGREVGARDEEVAVAYLTPYMEAEKRLARNEPAAARRKPKGRKFLIRYGQGRRARHRQEHRWRGARV